MMNMWPEQWVTLTQRERVAIILDYRLARREDRIGMEEYRRRIGPELRSYVACLMVTA